MRARLLVSLSLALASATLAAACDSNGGKPPAPAQSEISQTRDGEPVRPSSWGPAPPATLDARLLAAELARDPGAPAIEEGLRSGDASVEARAAWTLGRVGGEEAATRLTQLLDGDRGTEALAALALLDPPRDAAGQATAPEGQWKRLEDALWTRYAVTDDEGQAESLLFAIARVGGPESVQRLAVDLGRIPGHQDDAGRRRYVAGLHAVALMCARGLSLEERGRDAIAQGLDHPEPALRTSSAYALGRCVSSSAELLALTEERQVLLERLERQLSAGGDTRLTWKAFAAIGETPRAIPQNVLGEDPPDWTTEVEAVRALANTPSGRAALAQRLPHLPLEALLEQPRMHVVLETLRVLRASAATDAAVATMVDQVAAQQSALAPVEAPKSGDGGERARAHLALELATLRAISSGREEQLPDCAEFATFRALPRGYCASAVVEGLMHMSRHGGASPESMAKLPPEAQASSDDTARKQRIDRLLAMAADPKPATAAPAIAALAEVSDPRAKAALRQALTREDSGVQAAAATAVATRSIDAEKRDPEAVDALIEIVRSARNEDAVEARIAAIHALGSLGRAARSTVIEGGSRPDAPPESPWLESVVLPLASDPNVAVRDQARRALLGHPELVATFDIRRPERSASAFSADLDPDALTSGTKSAGMKIETTRGPISISFSEVPAPLNQANLAALASRGFFDGLTFHRVVPGFVVQGGDPRGDGYGGPGHLVPCEWSNLRYERGTVGIALAGKDTGGSQMFIAQTPQPHLDGRYTIVGRVTEGMEVVDRLLPGDAIVSVSVIPGSASSAAP